MAAKLIKQEEEFKEERKRPSRAEMMKVR